MVFFQISNKIKIFNFTNTAVYFGFVAIGLLTLTGCSSSKKEELGTFEDPKLALIETQKVLFLLSKNVNKGFESIHTIKEYENTKNKIFTLD